MAPWHVTAHFEIAVLLFESILRCFYIRFPCTAMLNGVLRAKPRSSACPNLVSIWKYEAPLVFLEYSGFVTC